MLNNLGVLAESGARLPEACAFYAQALEASDDADDRSGRATTLAHVERLLARSRSDDATLARCRQALTAPH